tara:strand:+ start:240 stop:611 length:372 start_codon:yes stop_codon:yes gene_type:complete
MAFKLGNRNKKVTYKGGVRVVTAPLDMGAMAEARNDGTIAISPNVNQSNKKLMGRIIKHEMKHMKDMKEGRAAYGDDWLMWEGKIYLRKTIDGVPVIDGPNGRWPEGDKNHPWEAEAIAAEKQ